MQFYKGMKPWLAWYSVIYSILKQTCMSSVLLSSPKAHETGRVGVCTIYIYMLF